MNADLKKRFPHAAYIDPTARVYGKVEIGENASLWPYAVIRAESCHVRIGGFTNLQDHVMVHVGYGKPTVVGDYCSITHRVVLHGCSIGDNCLIGIGATMMEGASSARTRSSPATASSPTTLSFRPTPSSWARRPRSCAR